MKTAFALVLATFSLSLFGLQKITLTTESFKDETGKDRVRWSPEKIVVNPGEDKLEITASHPLKGGFDFHGLFIPELKLAETIKRDETKTFNVSLKGIKPGTYKVGCQFHPAHVSAELIIPEPAPKGKGVQDKPSAESKPEKK